mmetsp:Transcript_57173/g.78548  ORF Transcript_57173/g.78548 Transcript_57173/m.78548 type:complete len:87 (+) Transcript_57173:464-724(+)
MLKFLILLNELIVSALESLLILDSLITIFTTLFSESSLVSEHLWQKLGIKSNSFNLFSNIFLELLSLIKQRLQFQLQIVFGIFNLT